MNPSVLVKIRLIVSLLLTVATVTETTLPAWAKARLVAVIVMRSTASSHNRALTASKELANAIATEPGWDARVIPSNGRNPGEAAGLIGAELYVIGQFVDGNSPHVTGAVFRVSTDERLSQFSYDAAPGSLPKSVNVGALLNGATGASAAPADSKVAPISSVTIPSGDLISVVMLRDIGSRISQEGDAFPVVTAEDYYYKGLLILPKGSPGYGVITHLKGAGSFHAGGELNFTVKRLVTPSRTDIAVETDGATADADKTTEQNGNVFGQYLLWGVGLFAKRGNDILIKKGTLFHVSTLGNAAVPVAGPKAAPAALDPAAQADVGGTSSSLAESVSVPTPMPTVATAAAKAVSGYSFAPPKNWSNAPTMADGSYGITALGAWKPQGRATGEDLQLTTQIVSELLSPSDFARQTYQSLQNALGRDNVRIFNAESICNGAQSGWYLESTANAGAQSAVIAEQIIGLVKGHSYVATYRRPQGTVEDAGARAALSSLCMPSPSA
ncbi:MAG TPA: hypothetical protein VIG47_02685 [Gemmatimonadaceae bacterium]|jgi:hypothetical protein